jgi:hypothetical protein
MLEAILKASSTTQDTVETRQGRRRLAFWTATKEISQHPNLASLPRSERRRLAKIAAKTGLGAV